MASWRDESLSWVDIIGILAGAIMGGGLVGLVWPLVSWPGHVVIVAALVWAAALITAAAQDA